MPYNGECHTTTVQLQPHVLPVQWWLPHYHTTTMTACPARDMVTDTISHYDYNQTSCPCNEDCHIITLWLGPHVLPVELWLTQYHTTNMTTRPARAMVTATLSHYDYDHRSCLCNGDWHDITLRLQPHVLHVQWGLLHYHTMTKTNILTVQWWLAQYHTMTMTTPPSRAMVTATLSHTVQPVLTLKIYLADPGKARGCSTNTFFVIKMT